MIYLASACYALYALGLMIPSVLHQFRYFRYRDNKWLKWKYSAKAVIMCLFWPYLLGKIKANGSKTTVTYY